MKIAVITGGTSGIGAHLSNGFAEQGYEVFTLDILEKKFDNEHIHFCRVNLRDEGQIRTCFHEILKQYGAIHVLVNNGANILVDGGMTN